MCCCCSALAIGHQESEDARNPENLSWTWGHPMRVPFLMPWRCCQKSEKEPPHYPERNRALPWLLAELLFFRCCNDWDVGIAFPRTQRSCASAKVWRVINSFRQNLNNISMPYQTKLCFSLAEYFLSECYINSFEGEKRWMSNKSETITSNKRTYQ